MCNMRTLKVLNLISISMYVPQSSPAINGPVVCITYSCIYPICHSFLENRKGICLFCVKQQICHSLVSRLAGVSTPKAWSVSLGVWIHFQLVMTAGEIEVFLAVPFHLLIIEIIFLPFDALKEKIGTYNSNNFCTNCQIGA